MSNKILLDSNIIIYFLKGNLEIIEGIREKEIYISEMTELELLSYHKLTLDELQILKDILSEFKIIDINSQIKKEVLRLRRKYNLKLVDSIILATANFLGIQVYSADKKLSVTSSDVDILLFDIKTK